MTKEKTKKTENYLIPELRRILDLDDPKQEANKKLTNTWMFINGELLYVFEFMFDSGEIVAGIEDNIHTAKRFNVLSLHPWLPETGLYPLPCGGFSLIIRQPKRQWLKSFSTSFYEIKSNITNAKLYSKCDSIFTILSKTSRKEIYVDGDKTIWYLDKKIGEIKDAQTILCSNMLFRQELYDWSKTCQ